MEEKWIFGGAQGLVFSLAHSLILMPNNGEERGPLIPLILSIPPSILSPSTFLSKKKKKKRSQSFIWLVLWMILFFFQMTFSRDVNLFREKLYMERPVFNGDLNVYFALAPSLTRYIYGFFFNYIFI